MVHSFGRGSEERLTDPKFLQLGLGLTPSRILEGGVSDRAPLNTSLLLGAVHGLLDLVLDRGMDMLAGIHGSGAAVHSLNVCRLGNRHEQLLQRGWGKALSEVHAPAPLQRRERRCRGIVEAPLPEDGREAA